jgi:hypothetical protein
LNKKEEEEEISAVGRQDRNNEAVVKGISLRTSAYSEKPWKGERTAREE